MAAAPLDILNGVDPGLQASIRSLAEAQDRITLMHKGVPVALNGNGLLGIARVKLLELMQVNAAAEGVRLQFEQPIRDLAILDRYDMVVGSDGVNKVG